MAKRRDADKESGELIGPAAGVQRDATPYPGMAKMDGMEERGGGELSLEEILMLYSQPINEEQAWAVCYQCCINLAQARRRNSGPAAGASVVDTAKRIEGPQDVRIQKDGAVKLQYEGCDGKSIPATSTEVIESLGIMIYKALDYGLKESEERELSPPLEQLIDLMTNMGEAERDACPDEGYEATEEEEEAEDDPINICNVRGYRDILKMCVSHLPSPGDAPCHYQAVCRALYAETRELRSFLEKIKSAKENLRKMGGEPSGDPSRDLNELQNADWAKFWMQVMGDLRNGVKLKKVQERQYNPLAIEFQLTPYEMLMDDIRSKRYKLRKVMVNNDIPPRLKKSAHEVILDFIRSRPPLNPAAARKLKPQPQVPPTLHEMILDEIKSERKLRPVSPDVIRRSRLGGGIYYSTPQLILTRQDVSSPDGRRKTSSTMTLSSLSNGGPGTPGGGAQALCQRKRLKAPTLSELDSSDSDDDITIGGRRSASSSSVSTSVVDDTSPESVLGRKTPPMFLPISSTPQPERRHAPQRRHSIEKETPTNVRQFIPPSRQSSKSLVGRIAHHLFPWTPLLLHSPPSTLHPLRSSYPVEVFVLNMVWSALSALYRGRKPVKEEFCFPVECLSLTVEEVMHIRQVLVKADLEKFQQYKDVYNAMKKGKLCFCCRSKRFSLFTWSYTCQFCKRPVCSQCCQKMRLPSKPYANLPIYSLGSTTTLSRDRVAALGKAASIAGPSATPTAAAISAGKGKATVKAAASAAAAGPSRAAAASAAAAGPSRAAAASAAAAGPSRAAAASAAAAGPSRAAAASAAAAGPSRKAAAPKPEKPSTSHHRLSLQKTMSKLSKHGSLEKSQSRDEVELPAELTEDWSTMEVCVDCKKFIHDIISSSKHSLSLATKRARLKRKTQSFYMSSPKGADYRPSERTINEI
ncbi:protein spire homolog 1-like isoform X2 [Salvelinus fontinalis]|uniref:protein spire homolog 1-like isoform X2 n=1 Tax=Salvelinus fontinalis TaxID=8038 RepID=UPI002486AAB0|nr:protein spire homolog 1-like isoform X2 [Salvelinus fontinalis]